ncbi:hypothetical protein MRX96_020899 [Rhipicephalus microplus]
MFAAAASVEGLYTKHQNVERYRVLALRVLTFGSTCFVRRRDSYGRATEEKDVTLEDWAAMARLQRSQDRLARIRNCERSIISGYRLSKSGTTEDAGPPSVDKTP